MPFTEGQRNLIYWASIAHLKFIRLRSEKGADHPTTVKAKAKHDHYLAQIKLIDQQNAVGGN